MPLALRIIRRRRWDTLPWLSEYEIQADALNDFGTKDNQLSLWIIDDNKSNLNRVVTAYAAKRDEVTNLDYALFDVQILSDLNVNYENAPGDTPDEMANSSWHIHAKELTGQDILELVKVVSELGLPDRLSHINILTLLADGVSKQILDRSRMLPKILEKVDKIINS